MQVAVIILNWNAGADTIDCVQRLLAWRTIEPHIWVIDNASHDDSVAILRATLPSVNIIENRCNQGFAGGTNRGIEAALLHGDLPIFLLNNDAYLEECALLQLLQTLAAHPRAAAVAPLLYTPGAPPKLLAAGYRNPALHHNTLIQEVPDVSHPYPVDYVSGSAVLLRAGALRVVELLDERYFFHTEVADLCRRFIHAGYSCLVDPAAHAYHNLERSSPLRSTLYTYYLLRNRFLYVRNFYRWGWLPLVAFWAGYTTLLAGKLALDRQPAAARAALLALRDGLLGRYGGQNARVLAACRSHSK